MRRTAGGLMAAAVAAGALVAAQPAVAQSGNPFSPTLPQPSISTPTTPTQPAPAVRSTATTSSGNGSLSGGDAIGIGIGAITVLGGISAFIWRDARRRAPVRQGAVATAGAGGRPGSKRAKPRKLSPAERRRRKRGRAR